MNWSLKNLAIRQKLLLITLVICLAVLSLALAAIFIFQIVHFRTNYKQDIATLADIVANNSTAALVFDDREAAAEIISSVRAKPNVRYACLANGRGEVVATFGTPAAAKRLSDYPAPGQFLFRDGNLLYVRQVVLDGKVIGRLHLCADYHSTFQHLLYFSGLVMALVLAGAALPALLLSHWLAGVITRPLLGLASAARQVADRNDYSIRVAPSASQDELGQLGGAFNQMLARIEEQDADLNLSRQKLGTLINSINGIVWEWSPKNAEFTFVSQQSEAILGYAPAEWLANPAFLKKIVHPDDFEKVTRGRSNAVTQGVPLLQEYRMLSASGSVVWIRESGLVSSAADGLILRGIFQDVTAQFLAADELKKLNRRLLEVSRQSGMAEVATGVLHNVGNVLNSVNVSVSLLGEQLQKSQLTKLQRTAGLLQQHAADLPQFLSSDERGRLVPPFIQQITEALAAEHERWGEELASLKRSVEHMKEIVAMQQSFARVSGVIESLDLRELVEDAIHINSAGLQRHGIDIVRDYQAVPRILTEKHKVMQILINVISNAKYAVEPVPARARRLTVRLQPGREGFVQVVTQDNGVGISKENLTRIFSLGFTTKKNGHGFGLHSGALAAKELGGALIAHSDGPGAGATFTLELPLVATAQPD